MPLPPSFQPLNTRLNPHDDLPPPYLGDDVTTDPKLESLAPPTQLTRSEPARSDDEGLPPAYHALDPLLAHLTLAAPLIHASTTTSSSSLPRYQLYQTTTKSGRPLTLSIRHLLPTECRRLSTASQHSGSEALRYDDDTTLYHISRHGPRAELRGLRAGTLDGRIELTSGTGVRGRWWKFWHVVRSQRFDALDPANEARIQKHGYRAEDEWERRVLFVVRGGVWWSGKDEKVAVEQDAGKKSKDGGLRILDAAGDKRGRDLVVACWVMRAWMGGGLRW
ncbi:uncharacterized protein BDZ99DRAFT_468673 [Mytilinidion resinicola]|uniref:Uncharacterized protein n=1 Tax=Mytilinidion resinicola TaxID=574789 RepID=A0A6A6Y1J6_9PEZI|nr:uncharacterized protein BDZ99DRAFT_468673 [Mytilinidion resinicola]KAF2802686.1 hypothetical protein BDZ99DRAFT_468673 [Mytilinidion resinicola]